MNVTNRKDFVVAIRALYLLGILAALLGPYPVLSVLLASLLIGAAWATNILKVSRTTNVKLTSVIFPDGRVRLESDREDTLEGILDGQQWATHWLSVLRFSDEDTTRTLVIRSAQQHGTDDYRRLKMWLRNDLCNNTSARRVLDS